MRIIIGAHHGAAHHWMMKAGMNASGGHGLGIVEQVQGDGAGAVGASMLSEVVGTRELLAAFAAFERLVLGVKGSGVALQMFLTAEATVADLADERLGGIFSKGLLAAATVGGSRGVVGRGACVSGSGIGLGAVVGGLGSSAALVAGSLGLLGSGVCGNVHDGQAGALGLLLPLVLVRVAVAARVGGGSKVQDVAVLKVLKVVFAPVAGLAKRLGVGRRARAAVDGKSGVLAEVDQAVDKVVVRVEVGEILKGGEARGETVEAGVAKAEGRGVGN